jgi:hypothetical protein
LLDVDGSAGTRLLQDLGVDINIFAEVCDDLVIAVARGEADDR